MNIGVSWNDSETPVPAKHVAVAATGERPPPEERAARLLVVWPVLKEAAPKRVRAATVVTIAVAEAGVIPAPRDEADFARARKRIKAVYRRWYDTCFLPCPNGAMEALHDMTGSSRCCGRGRTRAPDYSRLIFVDY